MENLPKDLLLIIFGYLDLKSLATVACVSRLWYQISELDILWNPYVNNEDGILKRYFPKRNLPSIFSNTSRVSMKQNTLRNLSFLPFEAYDEDILTVALDTGNNTTKFGICGQDMPSIEIPTLAASIM
jgi:hypothetical protein